MTDEGKMRTSDIQARLRHSSSAVTRAWIRDRKLNAVGRDVDAGEKLYLASDVEAAIEASVQRGPYQRRSRPLAEGPPHDHDLRGDSER